MPPDSLVLEREGAVLTIRLNKPDTLNSLTFESYRALIDTFLALRDDDGCRAVVVTGTGRGFCSGGGVRDIIEKLLDMTPPERYAFARMTCDLVAAMRGLHKPIVAAVNGIAAGAGAILALASDLRLFSERGKIAFLFVKVGLSGADMGAAWLLPRVVGLGRATDLLMTGRAVDAAEAERIGLATRVVAESALPGEARAAAEALAAGPAFALAMTKRMLDGEAAMSLEAALEAEAQAQSLCMESPEFREGYLAFVEKRAPRFAGLPAPRRFRG